MAILSLMEIPALKELIKPYGFTIHLHDACGGQSFSLEAIESETSDKVYDELEKFFSTHNMKITYFGKEKLDFVAK